MVRHLPSQRRANRRRRQLQFAFHRVRQVVLCLLYVARDRHYAIDSLPVPVMAFHDQAAPHFTYKLHLLVTLTGVILNVELAPANVADVTAGCELLAAYQDLVVIGDKTYGGKTGAAEDERYCGDGYTAHQGIRI